MVNIRNNSLRCSARAQKRQMVVATGRPITVVAEETMEGETMTVVSATSKVITGLFRCVDCLWLCSSDIVVSLRAIFVTDIYVPGWGVDAGEDRGGDGWGDNGGGGDEGDGWGEGGGWRRLLNVTTVNETETLNSTTVIFDLAISEGLSEECALAFESVLYNISGTACNPITNVTSLTLNKTWAAEHYADFCAIPLEDVIPNNETNICDITEFTTLFSEVRAACACTNIYATTFGRLLGELELFEQTLCLEMDEELCYFLDWTANFDQLLDGALRVGNYETYLTTSEIDAYCTGCSAEMALRTGNVLGRGHLNYNEWMLATIVDGLLEITCAIDFETGEYCLTSMLELDLFSVVNASHSKNYELIPDGLSMNNMCSSCTPLVYSTMDTVFAAVDGLITDDFNYTEHNLTLAEAGSYWNYFVDAPDNNTEHLFEDVHDTLCAVDNEGVLCMTLWDEVLQLYPKAVLTEGLMDCQFHYDVLDYHLGCCRTVLLQQAAVIFQTEIATDCELGPHSQSECTPEAFHIEFKLDTIPSTFDSGCFDVWGGEVSPVKLVNHALGGSDGDSDRFVEYVTGGYDTAFDWIISGDDMTGHPLKLVYEWHDLDRAGDYSDDFEGTVLVLDTTLFPEEKTCPTAFTVYDVQVVNSRNSASTKQISVSALITILMFCVVFLQH
jgi:hypothetical protein